MQMRFGFASGDIERWRVRLTPLRDAMTIAPARRPTAQLIKSMISSRTKDEVSAAAYERLRAQFGSPAKLARAEPGAVADVIGDVTHADAKAAWLVDALRLVEQTHPHFNLDFLGGLPLAAALAWLERLPGVARKVAASTLNASTLERPVLIVDTHVLRVLQRLGSISAKADIRAASEAVTGAMPGWEGRHFLDFHIKLKRLGQTACSAGQPDCGNCPLQGDCLTAGVTHEARDPAERNRPAPRSVPIYFQMEMDHGQNPGRDFGEDARYRLCDAVHPCA